jgi:hypothetical protein
MFVTPVEVGSGETITALYMAEKIVEAGGSVLFLSSAFARCFIEERFPKEIQDFTDDGEQNRIIWDLSLRKFRPDVIVFADYPLLFFTSGVSPLSDKEGWVQSLKEVDVCIATLDHTGFAQREMGLYFGPPHLSFHYESIPGIPEQMRILLPCPMNEPKPLIRRKGQPFRYWDIPLTITEDQRREVRRRYLENEDDYLIFHAVAHWAWQTTQIYEIPYYQFLPEILEYYLADLPKNVTVVSVNNGELLKKPSNAKIQIINLPSLPKSEYEALLFGSDLMITENKISISLGKAICGLIPCVILRNSYRFRELLQRLKGKLRQVVIAMETMRPGAVYPYDIFPSGMKEEVNQLGLYQDNSLTRGFKELEIYGEEETRHEIQSLLLDEVTRNFVYEQQLAYVKKVQRLDDAAQALHCLV